MQTRFATTTSTRAPAAREDAGSESRGVLEGLCRIYWYPLYALVRRRGHDADEARCLMQAYFAELLEKGYLEDFDPGRGRFRALLLASLNAFLTRGRDEARAWRRGGRADVISLDVDEVESRYLREPQDPLTPEQVFERRWALTLLERTLSRLRREQEGANRGREFAELEGYLTGERPGRSYRAVAAKLGTSEGTVRMTIHRLRRRFGRLLRSEIVETVSTPADVDDEVRHLRDVVSSRGPRQG